jgi:hypothetical protein
MEFVQDLHSRPIAIKQEKANEQHYEVPTSFLQLCLGPRMKYSSCLWPTETSSLGDAEDAILSSYCKEAKLGKGLRGVGEGECEAGKEGEGLKILDLGCGWGSLGLFLAEVSHAQEYGIGRDSELNISTTLWRRSRCCRTRERKSCISMLLPLPRVSRTSRSLLVMSMFTTLSRRAGESRPLSQAFITYL